MYFLLVVGRSRLFHVVPASTKFLVYMTRVGASVHTKTRNELGQSGTSWNQLEQAGTRWN